MDVLQSVDPFAHWRTSRLFSTLSNAAVNIQTEVSMETYVFNSFGKDEGARLLDPMLNFVRNPTGFQSGCTVLCFHRFSSSPAFGVGRVLDFCHFN